MTTEFHDPRPAILVTRGDAASDGAGVRMQRLIMSREIEMVDPFIMLDWFKSDDPDDYIGGFPDHPHRGFETVTYMLAGRMRHWDNKGHEGIIGPGDVQWMTAAGGIVHSEMPEQENGLMSGFQLWVNLPADRKMQPATYQEYAAASIPLDNRPEAGSSARVVAGTTSAGVTGPVTGVVTEPIFLDVAVNAGGSFVEPVPSGHHSFVVVHDGSLDIEAGAGKTLRTGELAVLGSGDHVILRGGSEGGKALLVAGKPLNEPIARGGPFVMNTRQEVLQAFDDFRSGRM